MDTIKIGLVGCGGRGRGAVASALNNSVTKNVKLFAIADPFPVTVDITAKLFNDSEEHKEKVDLPKERQFSGLDCCAQLLKTDVDVVFLCEPPGFRPRHFKAAVDSGKHIFIEKPVAVDAPGVRMVLEANAKAKARGSKQVVLGGHELRLEKKHREPIKMIHDGVLGELLYTRGFFNTGGLWTRARQPGQTEMQHQVTNWYYFVWLSGDHIVEQHCHDIDVMNWFVKDKHPVSANGMGGRSVRIGPEFGEIFDHHSVEFNYGDGIYGFSNCRQINGTWSSYSQHAYCTNGYVNLNGQGVVTMHIKGKEPRVWQFDEDSSLLEQNTLLDAIVNGKELNTVDTHAQSTMTAIMGRMATYSGKVVTWEDAINSQLDTFPKSLEWNADPGSKPGPDGIYPCAIPGVTKAW